MEWLDSEGIAVKAVVATHFHADCLAGLDEFHQRQIPSYGHQLTKALAIKDGATPPQNLLQESMTLDIGNEKIELNYFGEGHTRDNIVVWVEGEKILFGGCLIKAIGAGKGNIADANLEEWSNTVIKVKQSYKNAKIVIPGHGDHGTTQLLDFTIELFDPKLKGG